MRIECLPRIQEKLSTNWMRRLSVSLGPFVPFPRSPKPAMVSVGIPHELGTDDGNPGILSSLSTSRTNANSVPLLLKNVLYPKRKSLTRVGEKTRVLLTTNCFSSEVNFVPEPAGPGV